IPQHLFVDAILHTLEQPEALFLVLDERIALAVAAQADALLEMVEAVKVILPLRIDDLQHDAARDRLDHRAGGDRELLWLRRFTDLFELLRRDELPLYVLGHHAELAADNFLLRRVASRDRVPELFTNLRARQAPFIERRQLRRLEAEDLAEVFLELAEVPVLGSDRFVAARVQDVVEHALADGHQVVANANRLRIVLEPN